MPLRITLLTFLLLFPLNTAPVQAGGLVGRGEVRDAGAQAAAEAEKKHGLWANAAAQRRVQRVGRRVAQQAKYQEGTVYAFQILDMDEVNAFALPSGHVYVTRGLMEKVGSRDELLAAVLAHEVGHIAELHAYRRVQRAMRQTIAVGALGALFGKRLGRTGEAALVLGDALLFADYSQDQEIEADRYGVIVAHQAGYHASAMAEFLTILAADEKNPGVLKYLHSHPRSERRARLVSEFREEYLAGTADISKYTEPKPPAAAFSYSYPNFARLEREARAKE